jgi:hypothetical protein
MALFCLLLANDDRTLVREFKGGDNIGSIISLAHNFFGPVREGASL